MPCCASTTLSWLCAASRSARLRVNLGGMCCTIRTAACCPVGSAGTTSASARGPPVDAAIAAHCRARPGSANSACMWAPRAGRASTGIRRMAALRTGAEHAEQPLAEARDRVLAPVLLLGHEVHRAQLERADGRGGARARRTSSPPRSAAATRT